MNDLNNPLRAVESSEVRSKLLEELGALKTCHVCGTDSFTLLDSDLVLVLKDNQTIQVGKSFPVLPCTVTVCQKCGNVNLFSLIVLAKSSKDLNIYLPNPTVKPRTSVLGI